MVDKVTSFEEVGMDMIKSEESIENKKTVIVGVIYSFVGLIYFSNEIIAALFYSKSARFFADLCGSKNNLKLCIFMLITIIIFMALDLVNNVIKILIFLISSVGANHVILLVNSLITKSIFDQNVVFKGIAKNTYAIIILTFIFLIILWVKHIFARSNK